ncbi:hypothetical protein BH24ACT5_BH24ACT5_16850 [soil metagenome]
MPNLDLPKIDLPKIDLPKIDLARFDVRPIDLPGLDAARETLATSRPSAETVTRFVRNATDVGIGLMSLTAARTAEIPDAVRTLVTSQVRRVRAIR